MSPMSTVFAAAAVKWTAATATETAAVAQQGWQQNFVPPAARFAANCRCWLIASYRALLCAGGLKPNCKYVQMTNDRAEWLHMCVRAVILIACLKMLTNYK